MTTIEFYGSGKRAQLPSSWEELTPAQIRFIFRAYDECQRKGLSPLDFNIRVLYHLLGIRRRIPSWKIAPRSSLCENIYLLCERCLSFLFGTEGLPAAGDRLALSCKRLDNPLPVLHLAMFRKLYGPDTLCRDLTFGEFRMAATSLNQFFKTSDPDELDDCIRHLYRPPARGCNRAGRRVRPVGDDGSPSELKWLKRVPMWQKNLILVWFSACLEWLQREKIIIDGEEIDMKLLFAADGEPDRKAESFTWTDLLVQIAREGTVGTMAEVDREPLFSVFGIMYANYKENKRYEKTAKAQ